MSAITHTRNKFVFIPLGNEVLDFLTGKVTGFESLFNYLPVNVVPKGSFHILLTYINF